MTTRKSIRFCIAQLNLLVGDITGNKKLIIDAIKTAKNEHQADIIILPELALTAYPPEDLLYRTDLYRQIDQAITEIQSHCNEVFVVLGYPARFDNNIYNQASILTVSGSLLDYQKQNLPNYRVFDEQRYFTAGQKNDQLINIHGLNIGLTICEDIWQTKPAEALKAAGAELIININASPYHADKHDQRKKMLEQRIDESGLPIIYCNLVGGQDELVFDGASVVIDSNKKLVFEAPAFEKGLYYIDYAPEKIHFTPLQKTTSSVENQLASIYSALVLGTRDYIKKNGFNGAVLGLSGGIDSALTLAIACDAIGNENVQVLMMPSIYTADMSNEDAVLQAKNLNVNYDILPIEHPFESLKALLAPIFKGLKEDTTEENIQARIRGILLMALSNKTGKILLTTGNKSEMAVGYATLYGDMSGGFAPIKDVPKMLVYELARYVNRDKEIIPQRVIERPPSAELRPDQQDSDSLPDYEILDKILFEYIEHDQSPEKIISMGFEKDTVYRVTRLVDLNEYKRRQAAPGVRISKRAFGKDRRYPITSGYTERN